MVTAPGDTSLVTPLRLALTAQTSVTVSYQSLSGFFCQFSADWMKLAIN